MVENEKILSEKLKLNNPKNNLEVFEELNKLFKNDISKSLKWILLKRNSIFNSIEELENLHIDKLNIHMKLVEHIAFKNGYPYYYLKTYGIEYKIYHSNKLIFNYHGSYLKNNRGEKSELIKQYKLSIVEGIESIVQEVEKIWYLELK